MLRKNAEEEGDVQRKSLATNITPLIQRQNEVIEDEDEEEILQSKEPPGHTLGVTHDIGANIATLRGGGQQLPQSARSFFEPRFGYDFGNVRLHTDNQAVKTSHDLKAQAFTLDRDIYFGTGKYQPETNEGKRLIAHELTHTVQQGGASSI